MSLKEETGSERILPLGVTDANGTLRVNVLKALEKRYGSWPDAGVRVDKTARFISIRAPARNFLDLDLSAYDDLRYADHVRIFDERRRARLEAEQRRQEEGRRRGTKDDPSLDPHLKAGLELIALWMFKCAWPTAEYHSYKVLAAETEPKLVASGLQVFAVPIRLFGRTTVRSLFGQGNRDTWVDLTVSLTMNPFKDKIVKLELEFSDYDRGIFMPPGTTAHAILDIVDAPRTVCPKWSP